MRRLLTGVLLIAGLLALPLAAASPSPVRALSCVPVDVLDELAKAEFAFIGRVVAVAGGPPEPMHPRRVLFEVERWVKGDLGATVTVHGFEWSNPEPGARLAMIVGLDGGVLRMNECLFVDPDMLLAIASLTGQAETADPPAFLVGGEFGPARVMALDALGRLVGLGPGQGWVQSISVCPGGRRSAEIAFDWMGEGGPSVAIRDVSTLQVLNEVRLRPRDDGRGSADAVVCRDAEGSDVIVALGGIGIAELGSGQLIQGGTWSVAALAANVAVVREPERVPEGEIERFGISMVDLATGELSVLRPVTAQPTEVMSVAISPDGTHAAVLEQEFFIDRRDGMQLHLFDLREKALVASRRIPGPRGCDGCSGELAWMDGANLLVHNQSWDEVGEDLKSELRIVSVPQLDPVRELAGGRGTMGRIGGGALLGVDHRDGAYRLMATSLETGEQVEVRMVPTTNATAVAVLPSFDEAAAARLLGGPTEESTPTPRPTTGPTTSGSPTTTPSPGTGGPGGSPTSAEGTVWLVAPLAVALAGGLIAGAFFVRRRRR